MRSTFDFDFDFEAWRALAETDPAAYFRQRSDVIESFLASAPPRMIRDLRALQLLIDQSRLSAASPLRSTGQLIDMLGRHVGLLAGQIGDLGSCVRASPPQREGDEAAGGYLKAS